MRGRSVEQIACGDDLTGTGNGLVKSQRSRKKGGEARLEPASQHLLRIPAHLCRGVRQYFADC
jgi:molybdenum-dependent DNA-binding transcriptional regulator ModE